MILILLVDNDVFFIETNTFLGVISIQAFFIERDQLCWHMPMISAWDHS